MMKDKTVTIILKHSEGEDEIELEMETFVKIQFQARLENKTFEEKFKECLEDVIKDDNDSIKND